MVVTSSAGAPKAAFAQEARGALRHILFAPPFFCALLLLEEVCFLCVLCGESAGSGEDRVSSHIMISPRYSLAPSPRPEKEPEALAKARLALDFMALMTDWMDSGEPVKRAPEKVPNL